MLPVDAGRPSPDAAFQEAGRSARLSDVDRWPVIWAAILLLGSMLGWHWPVDVDRPTTTELLRLAALMPLFLLCAPIILRVALWLVIALLSLGAAATAAGRIDARPPAFAADMHGPSAWVAHEGVAALRVTARARIGVSGNWSAPARLLQWNNLDADRNESAASSGDHQAGRALERPAPGDGVIIRTSGPPPSLGDVIGGHWRLSPPRRTSVEGGFDEATWLVGRSLSWIATTDDRRSESKIARGGILRMLGEWQGSIQGRARELLSSALPPREAALAGAVLLGGGTERSLREPFIKLGLAHLFALSGLHVGIVSGVLLLLLRFGIHGPGLQFPVMSVALIIYALLVDTPDSVVRAVGLVLVTLMMKAAGRPIDGLRILGLLFWLNIMARPEGLFDVGLRLSYLAAAGIVLGQRLLEPSLTALPRILRWAARGLSVSLSAQTATLPVLAASFGVLPLAAPLVNLAAVPIFGLSATLLAAGLILSFAWNWAGQGLLATAWLLLRPLQAATATVAGPLDVLELGMPVWGPVRTIIYAAWLGLLVWILRRSPARMRLLAVPAHMALLVIAAVWGQGLPTGSSVRAWQFSVGQGDCALLVMPDGWTCLIDTGAGWHTGGGPVARDVIPFLRRMNQRRLDAVLLTHGHADHTGGAADLARAMRVDHWYVAGKAAASDSHANWSRPVAGDTLHVAGDWALVCIHPPAIDWTARNENDLSLSVALCRLGRMHGLWTGDLEAPGERMMLDSLPPVDEAGMDYWKAGHHGSKTSGTQELLSRTSPRLIVISCGVANRHRHPSHGPYGEMEHARTDLQATVRLTWDRHGRLRWQALHPLPRASSVQP